MTSLRVLSGWLGDLGPSVMLMVGGERVLINCGEGALRHLTEHSLQPARVRAILCASVAPEHFGGLPGLLMTQGDVGVTHQRIVGPSGIARMLHAARGYLCRPSLGLDVHETDPGASAEVSTIRGLQTTAIVTAGEGAHAGDAWTAPPTRSFASFRVHRDNGPAIDLPCIARRRHEGESGPASARARKRGRGGAPRHPAPEGAHPQEEEEELAALSAGARSAPAAVDGLAAATVPPSPPGSMGACASFLLRGQQTRGQFYPQKALALGVPKGPLFGTLSRGESVTLDSGRVVTPAEVADPPRPGPMVVVASTHSVGQARQLAAHAAWAGALGEAGRREGEGVVVVHAAAATAVLDDPAYARWAVAWGRHATHITLAPGHVGAPPAFRDAAYAHERLRHMLPSLFPALWTRRGEGEGQRAGADEAQESSVVREAVGAPSRGAQRAVLKGTADRFPPVTVPIAGGAAQAVVGDNLFTLSLTSRGPVRPRRTLVPAAVEAKVREEAAQSVERVEAPHTGGAVSAAEGAIRRVAGEWGDARVTLLGTGSAMPSKYRSVSAILVRAPRTSLLLDCGEGSYGQLLRACGGPEAVARVLSNLRVLVISHMHADHHMGTLRVLLERARAVAGARLPPLDVVGPLALADTLRAWEAQFPRLRGTVHFTHAATLAAGAAGSGAFDGDKHAALAARSLVRIDTAPATHIFDSHAVALRPEGAGDAPPALVYSGDTRPCVEVATLAKGAALLIHEATFGEGMEHEAVKRRHSTAAEALQVARDAGALRLCLTHFSQRYAKVAPGGGDELAFVGADLMTFRIADAAWMPSVSNSVAAALQPEEAEVEAAPDEPEE